MAAVSGVDPDLDVVATSMGATQAQKFRFVVIPGILGPYLELCVSLQFIQYSLLSSESSSFQSED